MSKLLTRSVRCALGFDCSALTPSAHALEQSLEFEQAAKADFARHFDLWRQDRSFATPYTGAIPPRPRTLPVSSSTLTCVERARWNSAPRRRPPAISTW